MQPVRADHQIELPDAAAFESDANLSTGLLQTADLISKDRLDRTLDPAENGRGQFSTSNTGVAALHDPGKSLDRESGDPLSGPIHHP